MRYFPLLLVLACTSERALSPSSGAERDRAPNEPVRADSSPASAAASTAASTAASAAAEPVPEWHDYSALRADELTEASAEAGTLAECEPVQPPALGRRQNERVLSGPPITNHIPPELVMAPIRKRAACLRRCYEQGMQRDPKLAGRITIQFVIDRDGWVRKAKVRERTLDDLAVANCVERAFLGLRYPAPDAAISVVYPLQFEP